MKKKGIYISIGIISLIVLVCLLGPVFSPWSAEEQMLEIRNQSPSLSHIFGTDSLGRDIFVRVCVGGRTTLFIAFICTLVTSLLGCIYGGIAALIEKLDKVLLAILDCLVSIPDVLMVLALSICFDCKNILAVCVIICVLGWCKMARLTRDLLKPLRNCEYVIQARLTGKKEIRIVLEHLIPNILPNVVSRAILSFSEFVFFETFLSYLGIGLKPPKTSWGNLISGAQNEFMSHPYQIFVYCAFLFFTLLAINCLGELLVQPPKEQCKDDEEIISETSAENENIEDRVDTPILKVENLCISYEASSKKVVNGISFSLFEGERVGLIGQSGCGKSTLAKGLSGMLSIANVSKKIEGDIYFHGSKIDINVAEERKKMIGYQGIAIIHQDAVGSLDPTMRIGKQIGEIIKLTANMSSKEIKSKVIEYLQMVGFCDDAETRMKQYPCQLSGGIAQRVVIAMTLAMQPSVIICDEPTAALDSANQNRIIDLLKTVAEKNRIALIFISHDMRNVGRIATRIFLMSDGKIHLADSMPEKNLPSRKEFIDRHTEKTALRVQHLVAGYEGKRVLDDVSFKLQPGETFGIVGESGSGKTSLVSAIIKRILIKQLPIEIDDKGYERDERKSMILPESISSLQYICQNPFSSFDPKWTIEKSIMEGYSDKDEMRKLLKSVGLDSEILKRTPAELSIGQCQRAAIVRALLKKPQLLICDEPTSSMDVVHQRLILELLRGLIAEREITCIFIAHDMEVISSVADRIAVMYRGQLVEIAPSTIYFERKTCHPYTEALMSGDYGREDESELSNVKGCLYYSHCKYRTKECSIKRPLLEQFGKNSLMDRHHFIACNSFNKEG